MAFVTPAGYNPSDLETSPRSKATAVFPPPNSMKIPGQLSEMADNAVAGPSGTNYTNTASSSRRTSKEDLPVGPSSAPPNPSVISVTHPPEFIHTHHPRRGSLTPLGLNVISPMPPVQMTCGSGNPPHSPVRSIGFTPTQAYQDSFSRDQCRRGSGASTSSTLTLSRPLQFGHGSSGSGSGNGRERRRSSLVPVYPPGYNPERRRSSLTPASSTLAPASPTMLHAKGVLTRPGSSDGHGGGSGLHTRHHTTHGARPLTSVRNQNAAVTAGEARRGSMPHMHHGGWTGPRWNPSLPTQRGSVGEEPLPDQGFKFGSIGTSPSGPSTPGAGPVPPAPAQKAIEISPSQRSTRVRMDAFQEAEAAEAERQRRAFISATFGDDGKRARERLSIGGPMAQAPLQPTRRPSLMLWEKLGMAAAAKVIEPDIAASSAPTLVLPKAMSHGEFVPRRGSLPIAIPLSPHGVSPSRRERRLDDSQLPDSDDAFGEEDEDEDLNEYPVGYDRDRLAPIRPAPPLLPLSDPGPRLLPSTLALQRASHLLNARRLQADPLPHPLPPSLHPPIPVDVTEFDIDFILAGSSAQLGRTKRPSNAQTNTSPDAPMDDIAPFASSAPAPMLRLGADDEDTFAKFVGKFDDEYGGRRGEWTFHAKPPSPTSGPESRQQDGSLRAVWESPGAGAFELYANGDVRSTRNGTTWRTIRKGVCEYEIEHVNRPSGFFERLTHSTGGGPRQSYVLATKAVHCEHGGIKTSSSSSSNTFSPTGVSFAAASSSGASPSSENRSRPIKERLRVSISEATRTMRLDSTDSSTTATPFNNKLSSSLPSGAMLTPKKKRRPSRDKEDDGSRTDHTSSSSSTMPRLLRVRSRDPGDEDKKGKDKDKESSSKDKAGFFKKSLMAPFKNTNFIAQYEGKKAQREERERERQQAHSWGGNTTHAGFIHPSGKNAPTPSYPPPSPQGRNSSSIRAGGSSSRTSSSDDPKLTFSGLGSDSTRQSTGSLVHQLQAREGKMWAEVPDDAVAMIIPDQGDIPGVGGADSNGNGNGNGNGLNNETSTLASASEISVEPRQALLVWYVPFNGDRSPTQTQSQTQRSAQASRSLASRLQSETPTESPSQSQSQPPPSPSSSLPKFQRLLRRRTSKDKELVKGSSSNRFSVVEQQQHPATTTTTSLGKAPKHPLPFRSFRIVARIVDLDGLRSTSNETNEDSSIRNKSRLITSSPTTTSGSVPAPSPAAASTSAQRPTALSVDSAIPLSSSKKPPLTSNKTDETTRTSSTGVTAATGVSLGSTAPTSTILAGRTISTVIAVCHSRSQGVEFVLEGLDRLGYCCGESAWGPTGYEEWRGTGLSEKGRELLELLWAGCTGVMGLNG